MTKFKKGGEAVLFRLQLFVVRIVVILFENLPIHVAYDIAKMFGLLAWAAMRSQRRQIAKNLELVFDGKVPFDQKEFARKVFINFCNMAVEVFLARRLFKPHTFLNYMIGEDISAYGPFKTSIEEFTDFATRKEMGIICSGHIGNFLLIGSAGACMGAPIAAVIHNQKNPLLMDYYIRVLKEGGIHAVPKKNSYNVLHEIIERKEYPTLVADQHGGRKSLYVEFMGKKAYTPAGSAALARKFNLPVYIGGLPRIGNFRFKLYATKFPLPPPLENKEEDLCNITKIINQELERVIRKHPEQWFWMHRRWRSYENQNETSSLTKP